EEVTILSTDPNPVTRPPAAVGPPPPGGGGDPARAPDFRRALRHGWVQRSGGLRRRNCIKEGGTFARGPDLKRVSSAALAAALAAAMATSAAAQQLKTWRHGIVQAKSDSGFVFMAANGGFAEKYGLKIEMVQFTGDALALKALLAGELDSYEGSPGGPMLAASQGADLRLLGCYWPTLTYGIYARQSIATAHDLRGKSMAISAPGALPDLLARAVLEQNGIPGSEVRFAVMGS